MSSSQDFLLEDAVGANLYPQARALLNIPAANLEKKAFVLGSNLANLAISLIVPAAVWLKSGDPLLYGATSSAVSGVIQYAYAMTRAGDETKEGKKEAFHHYPAIDVEYAQHKANQGPSKSLLYFKALMAGLLNGVKNSTPSLFIIAPTYSALSFLTRSLGLDRALTVGKVVVGDLLDVSCEKTKGCDAVDQLWGPDQFLKYAYFTPCSRDAAEASIVRSLMKQQIKSAQPTKDCL